ncbi:MAG: PQQ-binding-like beta-propeller repeat protein [Planctomycetaceae bacterium]
MSCFVLSCVAFVLSAAPASDWTEFRGSTGQGHADVSGLPLTWSETENVAWKVPIAGKGWSSPVVTGDRIYLTTGVAAESGGTDLRVLCLKANDGSSVWDVSVFTTEKAGEIHDKNSQASPTPIILDDRIYVHFGPHGTACLKSDGSIVWKNQKLTYSPQHGNGGSPAIWNDVIVICCDGRDARFVAGLNRKTGEEIWRTERELEPSRGFSFCTPLILTDADRTQAICPGSGGVWSYDPATGKQLWRVAYGEGYSVVPRPVAGHGLVYVCSGFGDGQLFAIDPTGSGDVTESHIRWKIKKGVPKSPSVLLLGNEIYMVDDNGVASCLDALTGEPVWQQRLTGGFSASPVDADGHVWFQNETGVTTVIQPGREFVRIAENSIGDGKTRTFASFAFVQNAILLRSETALYRLQTAQR